MAFIRKETWFLKEVTWKIIIEGSVGVFVIVNSDEGELIEK
jgi:roadblock/LC7 domain-containing protein